jgi:hypothetical protein
MSDHDLGDTQPVGVEWGDFRTVRVGIFECFSHNSRINEGDDTAEGGRGWESGVRADRRDVNKERVEVLLSGDKTSGSGDSGVTGSKFRDDQVGLREFWYLLEAGTSRETEQLTATWISRSEEELYGGSGKSCSLAGTSEICQRSDSSNSSIALFLTKTVLG